MKVEKRSIQQGNEPGGGGGGGQKSVEGKRWGLNAKNINAK